MLSIHLPVAIIEGGKGLRLLINIIHFLLDKNRKIYLERLTPYYQEYINNTLKYYFNL